MESAKSQKTVGNFGVFAVGIVWAVCEGKRGLCIGLGTSTAARDAKTTQGQTLCPAIT